MTQAEPLIKQVYFSNTSSAECTKEPTIEGSVSQTDRKRFQNTFY